MKKYNIIKNIALLTLLVSTMLVSCNTDQSIEYNPELISFPEATLTSFSPTTGFPGTPITITGTNFGDTKQAAKISFNGTNVNIDTEIESYSDTEMVVLVPENAVDGPISLNVWTNEVKSDSDFTYIPGVEISGLSKETSVIGDKIFINGSNFGTDANAITILFNEVEASILSISNTQIEVEVPESTSGLVKIVYDNGNRETVGPIFIYINASIVFDTFLETTPEFGGSFDRTGTQEGGYWPSTQPINFIGDREWEIHCNDQSGRDWGFVTPGSGLLKIGNQRSFGYDISDEPSVGYVKPTLLTLESNFNLGDYAQNAPPRVGRGFVFGFMPQILPSTTHGSAVRAFHGLVGVVLTPESNELLLYDGTATTWGEQIDAVPVPAGYDRNADHHLKLVVDTTTGLIVSLELDGNPITFNVTINSFTDTNTKYMVIGGNTNGLVHMDCYDVSFY